MKRLAGDYNCSRHTALSGLGFVEKKSDAQKSRCLALASWMYAKEKGIHPIGILVSAYIRIETSHIWQSIESRSVCIKRVFFLVENDE